MTQPSPHARNLGFTVAEVLVALVIIGIAIIGIAALYTDTTDTARESEPRLRAAELAEEIAARVSASEAVRTAYASVVGVVCTKPTQARRPEDAAALEAACWSEKVAADLPSGMGSITRDSTTAPPTYVIAVSWASEGGGAASYVLRVQ